MSFSILQKQFNQMILIIVKLNGSMNATSGAIMHWQAYKGKVNEYDVDRKYPHVMQKNQHYFPIKEGQYLSLKEINVKNVEYGIYRCTITKTKDCKFFRFNPKNTYTHLDVKVAIDYGLKIEMIQNNQPNFLYYSKDKIINGA